MPTTQYHRRRVSALALLLVLPLLTTAADAYDWPSYRGPSHDGRSAETGVFDAWPENGPTTLWRADLGSGYSATSVADGRVFTLFGDGKSEFLAAFSADRGEELWRVRLDVERKDSFGDGPRSTPSVAGGAVYALGAKGKLVAVKAESGEEIWSRDLVADFGASIPQWGISTSPTVFEEHLLVDVGGKDGHGVVALARSDGKLVWKAESGVPGYSTPLVVEAAGVEQALFFTGTKLVAVSPRDGKALWDYEWRTSYDVNAAMPVFLPPDRVFISSGYDKGAAVLRVKKTESGLAIEEVWKSREMRNHFNSSVLVDGHLYGFDNGTLKCIRADDGAERWAKRGFAKGSLLYADGHLVVLGERGQLALVEASPEGYREKALSEVFDAKTWTMPTLADGVLFVRSEKELVALDPRR